MIEVLGTTKSSIDNDNRVVTGKKGTFKVSFLRIIKIVTSNRGIVINVQYCYSNELDIKNVPNTKNYSEDKLIEVIKEMKSHHSFSEKVRSDIIKFFPKADILLEAVNNSFDIYRRFKQAEMNYDFGYARELRLELRECNSFIKNFKVD